MIMTPNPFGGIPGADATRLPFSNLERYAGWLARGAASSRVRESVKALGTTIAAQGDVAASVDALEADVAKLGSGEIVTLLRRALRDFRAALDTTAQ